MKKFKFTIDGTSYSVNVKSAEGNKAEIEVNGKSYAVELDQEVNPLKTPVIVRKEVTSKPGDNKVTAAPAPAAGAPSGTGKALRAPLPGSIIRYVAKEGDSIKKGDVLLVMESMKMENNILAEMDGVLTKFAVTEGQNVMTDDVLLYIA